MLRRRVCSWCLPFLFGVASVGLWGRWIFPGSSWAQPQTRSTQRPPCESLGEFTQALELLENQYIRPLRRKDLLAAAIDGMTAILDPHTVYLNPSQANLLREEIDGAFGGVGLVVQWEPQWLDEQGAEKKEPPKDAAEAEKTSRRVRLRVKTVVPQSPAELAKLQAGDAIVEIQGRAVAQFPSLGAAVMNMRGPVGTPVSFRVLRGQKEFDVQVKRGRVLSSPLAVQDLGDGVMHVRLREFSSGVAALLGQRLKARGAEHQKLVLDLRDNGGGLLDEAVQAADLFVDKGVLVRTRGRGQRELEQRRAHRLGTLRDLPIVVLINKASASASEILAGALQDHRRALVVGERSFGKGSVQIPYGLADGSMLKTTIALYYTPNDRVIQARGIAPDLWVSPQAPRFEDSRPELRSERDSARHLVPSGANALPARDELQDPQVPAARASLRAAAHDPQLRAAVEYLLAAERISGKK